MAGRPLSSLKALMLTWTLHQRPPAPDEYSCEIGGYRFTAPTLPALAERLLEAGTPDQETQGRRNTGPVCFHAASLQVLADSNITCL